MIDDEIYTVASTWIMAATGLPRARVRPADDGGTRPDLPYITMRILIQQVPDGEPELIFGLDDGDVTEQVRAPYTGTLQLDAYGRGGDSLLSLCTLALHTTAVRRALDDGSLTLYAMGGVNDLSALVDDEIEKRFQRDFYMAYAVEYTAPIIDDAAPGMATFEYDGLTGDQPTTVTVED